MKPDDLQADSIGCAEYVPSEENVALLTALLRTFSPSMSSQLAI